MWRFLRIVTAIASIVLFELGDVNEAIFSVALVAWLASEEKVSNNELG